MKLKNAYLLIFTVLIVVLVSCKKDDDDPIAEVVPSKLLSETAIEDDAEIVEYLKTHFYNSDEFQSPPAGFDYKIKFGVKEGANADKQSIYDSPNLITETIAIASSDFGRDDGEVITHKLYTLVAQQGSQTVKPTIGDNVILGYEGMFLDSISFDANSSQPTTLYLSGVTRGFGNGVKNFQIGTGPIENGDGTISYENYGVGTIFMPSGLGYFDRPPSGSNISRYSPLVFDIDVFDYLPDTDVDGDGIPSILEDLNNNGNLNDDNTDSDSESAIGFTPNHRDIDDDNDGILTIDEIELDAEGNFVGFKDTDGDGIPDHLDNDL